LHLQLYFPDYSTIIFNHVDCLRPSDSRKSINYGRVDFSSPAAPNYGWSGVIIEAAFNRQDTRGLKLNILNAYYDIEN
jgi:hypothetical protein